VRYLSSLIVWFFCPLILFGQSNDSLSSQLNKLNQKKHSIDLKIDTLENQRDSINAAISQLRTAINRIELKKKRKQGVPTKINFIGGTLRDKPSTTGNEIAKLQEGDEVIIYDWFQKPYFKASYKGKVGFIAYGSLQENKLVRQIESEIKQKKFEKIQKESPKLSRLIKQYGESTAKKLINGKIWIGMTDEMAREALGSPKDINRTTSSYGVREQWVYPYGKYLYFENGKLTSWQE